MRGLPSLVRRWRSRRRLRPALSVVVPVYNVEAYVAGTLDSLLSQTFPDLEVVVVVDGATDRSAAIAREYAERDRRVRVLEQPNAGLGAARNVGVRAARGQFLTFADADDLVPTSAYATMMATLTRTGSDMVVGTLKRDNGRRQVAMRLMRENHRVRRERVVLTDVPLMLADVFAVNKIYRRSFWDAAELSFPEGMRYEDQPTLTRAFLACTAFDVIPETVYVWRVRDDHSSITQGRHELADLRDRMESKRRSTDLVLDAGLPALVDVWFRDVLPVDMWEYFRAVPGCSPEYWSVLKAGVHDMWNEQTVTFDHTRVPAQQRLMGWLVDQDRRDELHDLIAFIDAHRGDIPVEMRDDHVIAQLPGVGDVDARLPASVYVLAEHEHIWEGRVTAAGWDGEVLQIEGFALILNAPTDTAATSLTGALVPLGRSGAGHRLDLRAEPEPRATQFVGRPRQNFDACGFRVSVDVAALMGTSDGDSTWRFDLRRTVGAVAGGGAVSHVHGADIDRTWHVIGDAATGRGQARLSELEDELVLECSSL